MQDIKQVDLHVCVCVFFHFFMHKVCSLYCCIDYVYIHRSAEYLCYMIILFCLVTNQH